MDYTKSEIRNGILQKRSCIDRHEVTLKSSIVSCKIYELPEYKKSRVIMCYMDYKNEVQTKNFIRKSLHLGKKISVPRMEKNNEGVLEIKAIYIDNIINDLEKGNFGILEPRSYINCEAKHCDIDLAIVPGVAFDRERNRIGFGKGFYDEYFRRESNSIIKVGVAYDFQIVDFFNPSEYDVPMNIIVTENRII